MWEHAVLPHACANQIRCEQSVGRIAVVDGARTKTVQYAVRPDEDQITVFKLVLCGIITCERTVFEIVRSYTLRFDVRDTKHGALGYVVRAPDRRTILEFLAH